MSQSSALRPRLTRQQRREQSLHTLRDLATNLQAAVNHSIAFGGNYEAVEVIAFHWSNDTMGVASLETELLEFLTRVYAYHCESYEIPTQNSAALLNSKLVNWSLERANKNTLRIYVYSGHAAGMGPEDLSWTIAGESNADGTIAGPRLNIKSVLYSCETLEGDCLYIFDCCSAGSIGLWDGPEAIAACGWEQASSANLNFCLTRVLIDALVDNNGAPITVASLFARLFRNASQNQVGACPVHIPKSNHPSITLKPLSIRDFRPSRHPRFSERVLLSIEVKDDHSERDVKAWEAWLSSNIPEDVLSVDIKIEATFQSHSTVLLITVPLEVWTMLPDHPGYNFVSHVTSNNGFSANRVALPHRPAQPRGENELLSPRKPVR
ncbi:hypothetical protein CBS115989_7812 [Aspergillus niger]|uniref:Contig An04c0200, genomic contig n=3 Tax=Aspergillus niger TaxID=5061 RepID=A2QJK1_ASPNC|nr:uncharacterized protein An04g07360 [Aspergillus niger]XP_025457249.1 uncharacterized protein BO96DRAFT_489015 [Aspergillus niger CBS 101883]RDH15505.1 hypothetical protein M747DRAFT_360584 [Aspergillus niger ATCC 13496]KAI2815245.1 hypothetical protein CBS115989_7812 [Aspergillus niger]KAI2825648.1 hypothetical protein CBS133816_8294 [Aspergillus niger]KAI2836093.1 hypothetical protein CBS11232_10284 [Aspergillus niger]KAI2843663.1 hypothetical protein CBS11350_5152 [Aspergillus niger]